VKTFLRQRMRQKRRRSIRRSQNQATNACRAFFGVSCRDLRTSVSARSSSASSSGANTGAYWRRRANELKSQNAALAAALNAKAVECREAEETANQLRAENVSLRVETGTSEGAEWDEGAFQRRLADYMEPLKGALSQVLGHTGALTESLTKAMQLASAPGRRSRSLAALSGRGQAPPLSAVSQPVQPLDVPRRAAEAGAAVVARVSPTIEGHAIYKPQIEIQRLDPGEIQRMQGATMGHEEEGEVAEEDEPLGPAFGRDEEPERPQRLFNAFRMSEIHEEDEPEVENDEPSRTPRRRNRMASLTGNSPIVLLDDVSSLLSRYNLTQESEAEEGEEGEDNGQHPNVELLVPRLVLERVKVNGRRNSNAGSNAARRSLFEADSERNEAARESHKDFEARLLNVNPLEGPSWLFGDQRGRKRLAKEIMERTKSSTHPNPEEDEEGPENDKPEAQAIDRPEQSEAEQPERSDTDGPARRQKRVNPDDGDHGQKPKKRVRYADSLPSTTTSPATSSALAPPKRASVPPTTSAEGNGRPRRRAAQTAVSSLREPALGSKLRQGDPNTESVYSDYVPKVKVKKDRSSKRGSRKK